MKNKSRKVDVKILELLRSVRGNFDVSEFNNFNTSVLKLVTPSRFAPKVDKKAMESQQRYYDDKIAFAEKLIKLDSGSTKCTNSSQIRALLNRNNVKMAEKVQKGLEGFMLDRSLFLFLRWHDQQKSKKRLETFSQAMARFRLYMIAGNFQKTATEQKEKERKLWAEKTGGMPPVQVWGLSDDAIRQLLEEEVYSKKEDLGAD